MSQNGQALRVTSIPMTPETVFADHRHPTHQVIWAAAGVLEVAAGEAVWVLPPTRALWMPAGVAHETRAHDSTRRLQGAHLDPARCAIAWPEPRPLVVTPLLAALLVHLEGALPRGPRARAAALVPDLLEPVPAVRIDLRLPTDDRGRAVADALLADPSDARPLARWGREVGASARTLSRIFVAETGVTFSRWRTTARVRGALAPLARGTPIGQVAGIVGYDTPSAFVAAFRRVTGSTPGAYLGRAG